MAVDTHERSHLRDASADWMRWWEEHGERELRCMLMTAWDPIGIGHIPTAWDEYDDYLAGVARRIRGGADADGVSETIAAYLDQVERDYMGLDRHASRQNQDLAEALVAWHEWSFLRRGRSPGEWTDED